MSSRKQVTLRPPPNVDFVHGYPGIPPGHGRPPAEIMGSIEVRFGKEALKTKWVKIAMKKVEILPGSGGTASSRDFIGQSPQDLLILPAGHDYDMIIAREFPFRIRLPETIPPSMELDREAGIKYELVASITRGLLRKDTSSVIEDRALIQIDKHELHSPWPIYNQPDSRAFTRDDLQLTTTRTQSCFSPGERAGVTATLVSNSFNAVHLRAFEMVLLETTTFRPGPKVKSSKKMGPQTRQKVLGERKVPVNASLFAGMRHTAELVCPIPFDHLTPTVNSARHIDITCKIVITAHVENLKPYTIELPVTLSNWQRNTSSEMVSRIGYAPNLSVGPPPRPTLVNNTSSSSNSNARESQYNLSPYAVPFSGPTPSGKERMSMVENDPIPYNATSPAAYRTSAAFPADEFGQQRPNGTYQSATAPMRQPVQEDRRAYVGSQGPIRKGYTNGLLGVPDKPQTPSDLTTLEETSSRPSAATTSNRFTVVNLSHEDESDPEIVKGSENFTQSSSLKPPYPTAEVEKQQLIDRDSKIASDAKPQYEKESASSSSAIHSGGSSTKQWLSAEEEKRRLFDQAQAKVARVQSSLATPSGSSKNAKPVSNPNRSSSAGQQHTWISAEEEKRRLFEQAKENVRKNQQTQDTRENPGSTEGSPSAEAFQRSGSPIYQQNPETRFSPCSVGASSGAALYQNAMAAVERAQLASVSPSAEQASSISSRQPISPGTNHTTEAPHRRYPTAEEEKAALRYKDAKDAVNRHVSSFGASGSSPPSNQSKILADPIPYDQLFPSRTEIRDGPGLPESGQSYGSFGTSPSSPEVSGNNHKMEGAPKTPPPSANAHNTGFSGPARGQKVSLPPPPSSGRAMPLSAAEEKALLRARHDAESRQGLGYSGYNDEVDRDPSISAGKQKAEGSMTPLPPPLMPRPPAHYILETQEADEKMQEESQSLHHDAGTDSQDMQWNNSSPSSQTDYSLNMRPFSPFDPALPEIMDRDNGSPVPPPPLPPKVPLQ